MYVFLAFTGFCLLLYALLILYYHQQWRSIPPGGKRPAAGAESTDNTAGVSVIIPARNEALHIRDCLEAILGQSYPATHTEIIVVNDFSTDETAAIAEAISSRVRVLNLAQWAGDEQLPSYKKKAIETGISQASGDLIICTDADCIAEPRWIETLVHAYRQNGYKIIAAPVKIRTDGSFLSVFQALDFISLQGITGAALQKNLYPLCNGANLAYERAAFYAVEGFRHIDHIASGDDMLLMGKMQARFPGLAGYLKDPAAIVSTAAAENLNVFFQQRIRWASKISHYGSGPTFITLALVYLLNLCLFLLFLLSFRYNSWHWLLVFLMIKTFSEYFFVSAVARFFEQRALMSYFILCQPFHILYTVIAGGFGAIGRYRWKGRMVK